jgi:hypothetical protein
MMNEDNMLDSVMEDVINGGAGNVDDGMDGDHESALASAGFGTDEDYGGGTHDWESGGWD